MTKYSLELIAQFLARNVMALNSDEITWDEYGRRKRAAWDLVAQGEPNIAGTDCARRHMQVQEYLDRMLKERSPFDIEASRTQTSTTLRTAFVPHAT